MAENYKYDVEHTKEGEVTVGVTVSFPYFRDEREKALKNLTKEVEIKGFRKGQVPSEVVEGQYGIQANSQVVQQVALKVTKEIIESGDASVLSPLTIKKVSDYEIGKQFKFNFTFLGAPEVDLRKIQAVKVFKPDAEKAGNEEVDKVLEEMWREDNARTKEELKKGTAAEGTTLLGPDGKPLKKVESKESPEKYSKKSLNDDWAKKMDPSVSSVQELEKKIKEALSSRKEQYNKALFSHNLYSKVAKALDLQAPKELVEAEMVNREEEFYATARMSGVSPAEYIRAQGISIETLRENWKKQVKSGIEQLLVITGVAKAAGLQASDAEAEKIKGEKEKLEQAKMKVLGNKVTKYLEENVKTE